jgi:DNA-binding transcriptional ArsR family regulator
MLGVTTQLGAPLPPNPHMDYSVRMAPIPKDLRPKAYASLELMLDVIHSTRAFVQTDLESIAIFLCVSEATMRPVLANPDVMRELATVERAPEELRGSITMLQVADRLDMARETVRRKAKQLVERKLLYVDDKGRIRSTPLFDDPAVRTAVEQIHEAVRRYRERLAKHGIPC